jgi:hypothetical protein
MTSDVFSLMQRFARTALRPGLLQIGVLSAVTGCTCDDMLPVPEATVQEALEVKRTTKPSVAPLANGCLPKPAEAAPATQALPNGGSIRVSAYGKDLTDGSGVSWNQPYPSPCLDDKPPRLGLPNAAWHANYTVEDNTVCFFVSGLYTHYGPNNRLQLGYHVVLSGATFEDGKSIKDVVVYEFTGVPSTQTAKKCLKLKQPKPPEGAASASASASSSAAPSSRGAASSRPAGSNRPAASSRPAGSNRPAGSK